MHSLPKHCGLKLFKYSMTILFLNNRIIFLIFSVGAWSEWSEFSECSKSCGRGIKFRTRLCYEEICPGYSKQTRECNNKKCTTGKFSIPFTLSIFFHLFRFLSN